MSPVPLHVLPELVLYVDVLQELARADHMKPLLRSVGMGFKAGVFDDQYPRLDPMDRCFDNAVKVARACNLIYCEGMMELRTDFGWVPLAHGWCCDHTGKVIDPTCHKYQHIPEVRYTGIPFNTGYVNWWYMESGYHGMLDGHKDGLHIGVYHDPVDEWLQLIAPAKIIT